MFSAMMLGARGSRLAARCAGIAIVLGGASMAGAATCDSLKSVTLPDATIDAVQPVAAGAFQQPGARGGRGNAMADLPAFCRVAITARPSSDSDIKIEVWLPAENWNQKYQAVGNGAWTGSIGYAAMADALRRGYATSSTDTGHVGGSASFAMGHPEKAIDFAYRSEHEMVLKSKAIINAFYGGAPKYSYWNGCSAGGRQALKEAEMFPADFDGIIAGSPGLDWSGRSAQAVRINQLLEKEDPRLSPAHLALLHDAVVNACDAQDGVKDGLISNPAACKFDPSVLSCKNGETSGCLTAAQVATAKAIYSPIRSHGRDMQGLAYGSELNWTDLGWSVSARATGLDHYRYLVYNDPEWTVSKFNVDADPAKLEQGVSGEIDARNADLKPFFARGGKLLMYHGWADPQISPLNATTYYKQVVKTVGATKLGDSYRLFMAPGMAHCGGGEGPNDFDKVGTLEQWVEKGKAPDQIVASHSKAGAVDRTRPLCPYPQVATYRGSGSIDEAASFVCK
ncbi:MAG TPA: tannase/feruloyl esterase family alpha/beta hydrolase [Vicinamibacterales bacterium]|nr:tannase/feruloyl esterase family alpha/beta hydrolase [Vicinamibacterales bacterium]